MVKRILICDDEEGIRESLKLILSDKYELITVDNGDSCLKSIENERNIYLVLLDIKMPKINGLDVLQQIKSRRPKLPVIIVSGYRAFEINEETTKRGAASYIVKPFDREEILNIVEKHI